MIVTSDTDLAHMQGFLFTDRYGHLYVDANRSCGAWVMRKITSLLGFRNYDLKKIIDCFTTSSQQNIHILKEKYTYHLTKKYSIYRNDAHLLMRACRALESPLPLDKKQNICFERFLKDKAIYHKIKQLQQSPDLAATSISSKAIDMLVLYSRLAQKCQCYEKLKQKLQKEELSCLTPSEYRDFEDLAYNHEDIKKIAALDPKIEPILRISQLAKKQLDAFSIEIARDAPMKSRLIVYAIDIAHEYGHWGFPKICQWISRQIYHSEIIHLALSVRKDLQYYVSDVSFLHRFRPLKVGDYLYDMYDLNWKALVAEEKHEVLRSLLGDSWETHLQEMFEVEMSKMHEDRARFSSLKNSIFHIVKRMLMPCWQAHTHAHALDQIPKIEGTMTCSCFVECVLAHVLKKVNEHLKEKTQTRDTFITIPLSTHTPHHDLPHQTIQTWSKVLTPVSMPAILSSIRAVEKN